MSGVGSTLSARLPLRQTGLEELPIPRALALASALGLLASFLAVLYDVVDTVGEPLLFYPVVVLPLVAATVLARSVRVVVALAIGAVLFVGGLGWHVLTLSTDLSVLVVVDNNLELLTGRTVLAIIRADLWALAITPTPVFVTWFLALRRWYLGAAAVGGGTLAFFVLTGDAGTTVTLLGVVGVGGLLAFGDIDTSEWSSAADRAALVLAAMVLAPFLLTIVPGGAATPVTFLNSEETTMEQNVLTSDSSLDVIGSLEQSAETRFIVESDEPHLWRTNSFDRYTGDGWVRTGDADRYTGELDGPPGETERLTQEFRIRSSIDLMPAAWRPVSVDGNIAESTLITSEGGLATERTLSVGNEYEVTSEVPKPSVETLTAAGTDYPADVLEEYTQLPASTPDRVADRTEHITQNAENPYEAARIIESWLKTNREYSLDVDKPEGDIADAFLFEMDAGYCTYYATTMVTMLRTQGVPARMAVGYTTGERVDENEYRVRGLNSHAWVEVYFPEVGWITFDPTPPDPREQVEQAALEQRGGGGGGGSGGEGGGSGPVRAPETTTPDGPEGTPDPAGADAPEVADDEPQVEDPAENPAVGEGPDAPDGEGGFTLPEAPSRKQLALGAIALLGIVAGVRQSGLAARLSRAVTVRYQRRLDPETDVERAYERLVLVLESRHRSRKTGETVRQYLDAIDAGEAARRLVELHEQARYAETVTEEQADEAVELVDRVRRDG